MNEKPISMATLKDLADAGLINEIHAWALPNGRGYHLIARTRTGARILHKTRSAALPRRFRSLDSLAGNCRALGFKRFEVVNLRVN